jgi:hypothetical protein
LVFDGFEFGVGVGSEFEGVGFGEGSAGFFEREGDGVSG